MSVFPIIAASTGEVGAHAHRSRVPTHQPHRRSQSDRPHSMLGHCSQHPHRSRVQATSCRRCIELVAGSTSSDRLDGPMAAADGGHGAEGDGPESGLHSTFSASWSQTGYDETSRRSQRGQGVAAAGSHPQAHRSSSRPSEDIQAWHRLSEP